MTAFKLIIVNFSLLFILCELMLRFAWQSPYVPSYDEAYFHEPNQSVSFKNVSKIYGNTDVIYFRTDSYGAIVGPEKTKNILLNDEYAIALGGSTTECALVTENKRWPDLLETPTINFGKSRLNSSHTLKNLAFVINNYQMEPSFIFIMDGVNNLSAYLSRGPEGLFNQNPKGFYRLALTHSYTLALIWNNIKSNDYFSFYKAQVSLNNQIPLIKEKELKKYWNKEKNSILNSQIEVFKKFKETINNKLSKIVILTQPHAFEENHIPIKTELRSTPIINNKRLSFKQAKWLMDSYNEITVKAAMLSNLLLIDVSLCFQKVDSSSLFYDAYHFTEKGSEYFAKCLSNKLSFTN